MTAEAPPAPAGRAALAALVWVGVTFALSRWGAYLVPSALKPMPLETFSAIWQTLATAAGFGATALLVPHPAKLLGLRPPRARGLLLSALLSPSLFVAALSLGIWVALPTLIEEFQRGGAAVSRQNLGELGRVIRQAPAALVILWVSFIAPASEELCFRGSLWGAIERLAARLQPPPEAPPEPGSDDEPLPSGIIQRSALERAWGAMSGRWAALAATVGQAAVFGAMHLGVPGGAGIIRVVSATVLGLGCGLARQLSGTLWAPLLLHAAYNLIALGHSRDWYVSETFGKPYGIPTLMVLVGALALVVMVPVALVMRPRQHHPTA